MIRKFSRSKGSGTRKKANVRKMAPMAAWYALTVAPRKEKITAQTLRAEGFEDFLPLYSSTRQWSDRIKRLENPLFPGYVFCRFGSEGTGADGL